MVRFHALSTSPFFCTMVLFAHNVKKIKSAIDENVDFDVTNNEDFF